ncbi:dihydrofolate reductase [Cytobacillus purgationiresistens]|uniref:Dihydrofolate reductase n=1 Tax=Cytobacillus purgationiresistens TaxID=863449 RepID=A0ABU0AJZ8_9BACI|nr:dihydrofolate reductase [Cytobacillus purgationiresistens]
MDRHRKVIYSMMVSLDGFIESKDGNINWSLPDEELSLAF